VEQLIENAKDWQEARLIRGLTLESASDGICSAGYLSLIETGKRSPSAKISSLLRDRYGLASSDKGSPIFEPHPLFTLMSAARPYSVPTPEVEALPSHLRAYHSALQAYKANDFDTASRLMSPFIGRVNQSAQFRYAANSLLVTSLRLGGDLSSACDVGQRCLRDLEVYRAKLPHEHANLSLVVATVLSLTGMQFLASEILNGLLDIVSNAGELRAKSLWAASDLAISNGDYELAARYASLASVEFGHLEDPIRAALLKSNSFWCQLMHAGPSVDFTLEEIRAVSRTLQQSQLSHHRNTILLTEAMWCALRDYPEIARQALMQFEPGLGLQAEALTAELAVEIGAIYFVLHDKVRAAEWFERFVEFDLNPDNGVSSIAAVRLAAELAEGLALTSSALKYWRRTADAGRLIGHEIMMFSSTSNLNSESQANKD
jgi:hypothetical protein